MPEAAWAGMVAPMRFERTTCSLGGSCSIQLSYGTHAGLRGSQSSSCAFVLEPPSPAGLGRAAGLGSFARGHGLVADFVEAWKRDPKTPTVIKEELGTLTIHEAFKVK